MTRILIAVDDSPASLEAVDRAHQLFGDDAEYLAINVFESAPPALAVLEAPVTWGMVWQYDVFGATPEDTATARELAEREAGEAVGHGGFVNSEAIGEVGDPADAILQAAHDHEVDVIVVGSHERSWFSRLFDPSVSAQIVKRADVSVLVAR